MSRSLRFELFVPSVGGTILLFPSSLILITLSLSVLHTRINKQTFLLNHNLYFAEMVIVYMFNCFLFFSRFGAFPAHYQTATNIFSFWLSRWEIHSPAKTASFLIMHHCPVPLIRHFSPPVPRRPGDNYCIYSPLNGARLAVTCVALRVFLSYCVIFILYKVQDKYLHSSTGRVFSTNTT